MKSQEEKRINNQIKEAEVKAEAYEQLKKEKFEDLKRRCDENI